EPVRDFLARHGLDAAAPLESWPASDWRAFWHGEADGPFPGLAAMLERAYEDNRSEAFRRALDVYREPVVCPACDGSRLRTEARAVRFGGRSIHELTAMAVDDLLPFVRNLVRPADGSELAVAGDRDPSFEAITAPLLVEIAGRLGYLIDVGLEYLS